MEFPRDLAQVPEDIEKRGVLRDEMVHKVRSRVGILLSIYFTDGWMPQKREAIVNCLKDYLSFFADRLTHFQVGEERKMRRYDGTDVPGPYAELADLGQNELAYINMKRADPNEPDDPSLFRFMAFGHKNRPRWPSSGIKAHFPPAFVFGDPDRFVELVRVWCDRVSAIHGSAGLGALSNPGSELPDDAYYYPWLKQYPGLEYDAMGSYWTETEEGGWEKPRSSNWLTVLGDENIQALGGPTAAQAAVTEDVSFARFSSGVVLRAGALPVLGDTANGGVPESYRAVARLIKPIRFEGYRWGVIKEPFPTDGPEVTLEWLRRFD